MSKQLDSILSRATSATPRPAAISQPQATPNIKVVEPAPEPEKKPKPAAKPKAKTQEPQKAVQAYVPASVARALNIRAAEEGVTVRTLILQGLKAVGIEVSEEELRDRRK